ncbi:leucine-rich repeat-containing protein 41 [Xyrichtys novacula]|nr:leucine-rich repeat-containing protein 41 [Xyrichtys novacula]
MSGPKHVIDLHTEDEAKHQVMRMLFTVVFYGFTNFYVKKNIKNLNTPPFLWAAAKCVTQFLLDACLNDRLKRLIADERPLLDLFERRMTSVIISHSLDLSKEKNRAGLYIFHRLVDHGVANRLVIHNDCPFVLAWVLHKRGSQYVHPELKELMLTRKKSCLPQDTSDGASCSSLLAGRASGDLDDHAMPCKRPKTSFVSSKEEEGSGTTNFDLDPEVLCQAFAPCDDQPTGTCPRGQIHILEFSNCRSESLKVLNSALPTFFSLRSLILHSYLTFKDSDVLDLARSLRQLSESSCSSLTNLSVCALPYTKLMKFLLNANSKMKSLHVGINTVVPCTQVPESDMSDIKADLPLEKLTINVTEFQTDLQLVTSVLRQAPHLTTLYVSGMRLPTGSSQSLLLTTLSESNPCLKSLHLEDMNLSDCLPEIIHLLQKCKLEELKLNDCRLLERWSNKKSSLTQLMTALRTVPSLHTLSLAQNRLAKTVCVLAELFSGSSPSSVKRLDISSNFIQPADLLEFAETLRTYHPPHKLTLDLRKNPGDRDSETWDTALKTLPPSCIPLVEGWVFTNTMADHISNM